MNAFEPVDLFAGMAERRRQPDWAAMRTNGTFPDRPAAVSNDQTRPLTWNAHEGRVEMIERAAAEMVAGDRVQAAVYLAMIVPTCRDHVDLALDLSVATLKAVARLTDTLAHLTDQ